MKRGIVKSVNRSGFTMLELILVISIMIILSLAAITSVDISGGDMEGVAVNLRSNIQFAQDLAMTHGSSYGFRSTSATGYEIFEGVPGTPARNPLTRSDFEVNISPVQFSGSVTTITFNSDGIPDNVSDVIIQLTEGSHNRSITVASETGYVSLSTGP